MLKDADARRILEALRATGADFAEIYMERSTRTALVLDDGDLDAALGISDGGAALRLTAGERTFFANANTADPLELMEMARRLAAPLEGAPRSGPEQFREVPSPASLPVRVTPGDIPVDAKVALLRRADGAGRGADPRVTQVTARYIDSLQEVALWNSLGERAAESRTLTTLAVQVLARDGDDLRTGYQAESGSVGFELFDDETPETIALEAARLAVLQLEAKPAPAGTFTVVLGSSAGGTMVHEACGHGLEGDFADKGLSVYTGKVGQQVAAGCVTVIDDGTLPGKRGSSRYDDEGVPASRVVLIDKGVLKGFLHSRRSARRLGMSPTGNGRRESFRHLPLPRMRNTLIAPGSDDREEILASVADGIYVARMGGGEVDIASGQFVFHCPEAYRIRDGRIREPLRDVTLAGNGPEVLRTIDRVGSDLEFQVGTCGKDGQGVPVADAQPTLRIPALVVGGAESAS